MKQKLFLWLSGAAAGVSLELAAAIVVSSALHLGYVMLRPAWLPECVGGEIPATVLQTALFALSGAFIKQMLNSARSD